MPVFRGVSRVLGVPGFVGVPGFGLGLGLGSACATPSGELRAECVEPLCPEVPERLQPPVDVLQRSGLDRVQATGALGSDPGEAVLTEHAQVLRHGRLRDAELRTDDSHDVAGSLLLHEDQLENAPADRITEDIERVHKAILVGNAYISQCLY